MKRLEDPAVYSGASSAADVTALQKRLAELDARIRELEDLWLELSENGEA